MHLSFLRRAAACAALALLASCGGGTVDSQFAPTRVLAVGDGFADLGQDGALYTINDGSVNNWSLYVAQEYGLSLAASASGGLSYAIGNARVNTHPDAAGVTATATVKEQVDALLAGTTPTADDLVILNAGTSDLIAEAQSYFSGTQTEDQLVANAGQAGTDLGAQVRRLVDAGATHVVVVGPYDLGKSVWAQQLDQASVLEEATTQFNSQLKISIVDLGETVLYVDAAYYFNLVAGTPSSYSLDTVDTAACTSVDSGAGIGTGTGQVNSNLCDSSTLQSGIDASTYLFADRVYVTPVAHRLFGAYAYDKIHDRW
jgi:phospholipase/lecithinase/hemolysin